MFDVLVIASLYKLDRVTIPVSCIVLYPDSNPDDVYRTILYSFDAHGYCARLPCVLMPPFLLTSDFINY